MTDTDTAIKEGKEMVWEQSLVFVLFSSMGFELSKKVKT